MAQHHSCRCSPELSFSLADSIPIFLLGLWPLPFDTSAASLPPGWVLGQFPRRPDPSVGVTAPRPLPNSGTRAPKLYPHLHPVTCSTTRRSTDISHPSSNCFSRGLQFLRTCLWLVARAKTVGDSLGSSLSLNPTALHQVPFPVPSHVSVLPTTSRPIFSLPDCLPSLVLPACIPYALVCLYFLNLAVPGPSCSIQNLLVGGCGI